jgi:Ca2+-binding RTX toxin-like protein
MPRLNARLFADDFNTSFYGIDGGAGSYLAARSARQALSAATFAGAGKLSTAFAIDGVGDLKPPLPGTGLLVVTPDEAGAGIGVAPGNPVLTVDAAHTIGTINTNGDEDFYKVTLEAGKTYQIGMYGYTGPVGSPGPGGTPLPDSYIEIRTADGTTKGHLVVSGDGGADTPANDVNSGFDVLLTFTPDTTGTYYINARAFDNDPTDGTTGEGVGDYELFVHDATNDPSIYHPYYDVDSPLYAIDWGTRVNKVHQSVANPDGNEGTRSTGNAQGTPNYSDATALAALAAAQGVNITGKNVITIYFAKAGDVFVSNDPTNPGLPPATITAVGVQDFEHTAVITALAEFAKVADVVYLEVQDRNQADFIYTSYQGTPGPGVSLLGSMSPPDESDEGLAQFNSGDERWNARDLAQGGFSFVTLIHEFGHGHGLAHPHDNGGHSGIMRGVESEGVIADYTTGDFDLNQGVFTMMSYEDGWQTSPYGNAETDVGYGYRGSLMAFDIAAIQDKYGVNEEWATGDDTYVLKDVNEAGTYYRSIWDAGGTDTIVYSGTKDANIDLRPATLQYEYGGGGWVSFAFGIYGGFTIANGVTIENATSGDGNDTLRGNSANNRLDGGGGNDTFYVHAGGNDTIIGGAGNDVILFGAAMNFFDAVDGGSGIDQIALQGGGGVAFGAGVVNVESLTLLSGLDSRFGDTLRNLYDYVITTQDVNVAAGAQLIVDAAGLVGGEDLTFNGGAETDGSFFICGGLGTDTLTGGAKNDVFLFGSAGQFGAGDVVNGGAGIDQLALRGNYTVAFGAGQLVGVESIGLVSAQDTRFGALGTNYSYNLTLADGNVAAGVQMIVDAAQLRGATETLTFNGSAETDGSFRVFGGLNGDTITGGAGADNLQGNGGADVLTGGGGADIFKYLSASDSTAAAKDQILDFAPGTDKIDLSRIDANSGLAGDQAFAWIGSNAFSNTAGELRATLSNGVWTVEGDINGDGVADLVIAVTTPGAAPLGAGDFLP